MTPAQVERHIRVEGLDQLKAALAEGRGAIILLAHMGPWEALAQLPGWPGSTALRCPSVPCIARSMTSGCISVFKSPPEVSADFSDCRRAQMDQVFDAVGACVRGPPVKHIMAKKRIRVALVDCGEPAHVALGILRLVEDLMSSNSRLQGMRTMCFIPAWVTTCCATRA